MNPRAILRVLHRYARRQSTICAEVWLTVPWSLFPATMPNRGQVALELPGYDWNATLPNRATGSTMLLFLLADAGERGRGCGYERVGDVAMLSIPMRSYQYRAVARALGAVFRCAGRLGVSVRLFRSNPWRPMGPRWKNVVVKPVAP